MDIVINFGGFYQGIHASLVDIAIESELEYLQKEDNSLDVDTFYNSIDYKTTCYEYTKQYINQLFDYIKQCFGIKLTTKKKNVSISSPKEYNFYTDVIVLSDVSKSVQSNLKRLFRYLIEDDKKFREYVRYKTTSRDGYIPYYTYDEIVNLEIPNASYDMAISYIANEFNEEAFNYDNIDITVSYIN